MLSNHFPFNNNSTSSAKEQLIVKRAVLWKSEGHSGFVGIVDPNRCQGQLSYSSELGVVADCSDSISLINCNLPKSQKC